MKSLIINLTPAEEAQLSAAAMQTGLPPEAFAEKLVRDHLPTTIVVNELNGKLLQRQAQDQVKLVPSRTAADIFAQWEIEAEGMTDAERDAEDRFWEDFQQGINETRSALGMRQL